jgi:hypothetical protein
VENNDFAYIDNREHLLDGPRRTIMTYEKGGASDASHF